MPLIDDIKTAVGECKPVELEGGKTIQDLAKEAEISEVECLCALNKLEKEGKVQKALVKVDNSIRKVYAEKQVVKQEKKV